MEFGENEEIQRIKDNYEPQFNAVMSYLAELHGSGSDNAEAIAAEAAEEEAEHRRLMALNEEENQRVAEFRRRSEAAELDRRVAHLQQRKQRVEERAQHFREAALRLLQDTEEFTASLIPPEQFEAALAEAYDNPVCYDFAITLDGKVFQGTRTDPSAEPGHVTALPREPPTPYAEAVSEGRQLPPLPHWTPDPPKGGDEELAKVEAKA